MEHQSDNRRSRKGITITATELRTRLGMYLERSKEEDIYVTKNGILVSRLTNPCGYRHLSAEPPSRTASEDVPFERRDS